MTPTLTANILIVKINKVKPHWRGVGRGEGGAMPLHMLGEELSMTDPAEEWSTEKNRQLQAPQGKMDIVSPTKTELSSGSVEEEPQHQHLISLQGLSLRTTSPNFLSLSHKILFLSFLPWFISGFVLAHLSWIAVACYFQINSSFAGRITGSFIFKVNIVNSFLHPLTRNIKIAVGHTLRELDDIKLCLSLPSRSLPRRARLIYISKKDVKKAKFQQSVLTG